MNALIIFILFFLLTPVFAHAFLPPEFFVQGLTSIWVLLAGGVAVGLAPLLIFFKFLKELFREHKKVVIFIIVQNIILTIVLGLFFYYRFYKPLYQNSYLFTPNQTNLEIKTLQPNYISVNGFLRDNQADFVNDEWGMKAVDIKSTIDVGKKVYFIDIREIEEFDAGHITGAKHMRAMDLLKDYKQILGLFSISELDFEKSLFIVYCHDGDRGSEVAVNFKKNNIKYLIGGIEYLYRYNVLPHTGSVISDAKIFDKKYQYKFQTLAKNAITLIKNENAFVVDVRNPYFYKSKHIKGSLSFSINLLTTEEYENGLKEILENKDHKIVILADSYANLFYANLIILRLERDNGFRDNQFYIVFNQFKDLEKDTGIEFEISEESNI